MRKMMTLILAATLMTGCYTSFDARPVNPTPIYDAQWQYRAWHHPYRYYGYQPYYVVPHHKEVIIIKPKPHDEPKRDFGNKRQTGNRR